MEAKRPIKIAIFASGGGSNAKKILESLSEYTEAEAVLLVTNNADSGVFDFGSSYGLPVELLGKKEFRNGDYLLSLLKSFDVDLIVLAGYLKLIPSKLVSEFPNRILNIHPALLPAYGGKGMYGMNVHRAVIQNREAESGITIHYVNERYDEGEIIFRESLEVESDWTPEVLQKAVLRLEHQYFSEVIKNVCKKLYLENK